MEFLNFSRSSLSSYVPNFIKESRSCQIAGIALTAVICSITFAIFRSIKMTARDQSVEDKNIIPQLVNQEEQKAQELRLQEELRAREEEKLKVLGKEKKRLEDAELEISKIDQNHSEKELLSALIHIKRVLKGDEQLQPIIDDLKQGEITKESYDKVKEYVHSLYSKTHDNGVLTQDQLESCRKLSKLLLQLKGKYLITSKEIREYKKNLQKRFIDSFREVSKDNTINEQGFDRYCAYRRKLDAINGCLESLAENKSIFAEARGNTIDDGKVIDVSFDGGEMSCLVSGHSYSIETMAINSFAEKNDKNTLRELHQKNAIKTLFAEELDTEVVYLKKPPFTKGKYIRSPFISACKKYFEDSTSTCWNNLNDENKSYNEKIEAIENIANIYCWLNYRTRVVNRLYDLSDHPEQKIKKLRIGTKVYKEPVITKFKTFFSTYNQFISFCVNKEEIIIPATSKVLIYIDYPKDMFNNHVKKDIRKFF